MVERTSFDEAGIKDILVKAGLWHDVLGLDQAKLKALIAGGGLKPEDVRRLETVKRVISSYPQLRARELREVD
ncbi:MAG: hypothetical protein HYX96_05175 [Chloroflexi bacterium]|nr:hypothetical protein [Chloroflexota bacterium]